MQTEPASNDRPLALGAALAALRDDLARQPAPVLSRAAVRALERPLVQPAPRRAAGGAGSATRWTRPGDAARSLRMLGPPMVMLGTTAGAVLLVLAVALVGLRPALPVAAPTSAATPAFVPVVAEERLAALAGGAHGQAWLVSTELPQQRLGQLGLPYDPARANETLPAELLVTPTGEVLAVRLLQ